jgi:hypothetical protein
MSKYRIEVTETTVYELDARDEADAYNKVHNSSDVKVVSVATITDNVWEVDY